MPGPGIRGKKSKGGFYLNCTFCHRDNRYTDEGKIHGPFPTKAAAIKKAERYPMFVLNMGTAPTLNQYMDEFKGKFVYDARRDCPNNGRLLSIEVEDASIGFWISKVKEGGNKPKWRPMY